MFKNHPKGLYALALANTGERFGYYTMMAIFVLFLQAKFGFDSAGATLLNSIFLASIYFLPLAGGIIADKWLGYGKTVTIGIIVMFAGYLLMTIPGMGMIPMIVALFIIALGTGLFKGNLQVMVGNLYDNPKYKERRDPGFSLFYMAINIGAMFAPAAATAVTDIFLKKAGLFYDAKIPALAHQFLNGTIKPEGSADLNMLVSAQNTGINDLTQFCELYIEKLSESYNYAFGVACISLIVSMLIFLVFRKTFKHADYNSKQLATQTNKTVVEPELTKKQTAERVFALVLVFFVVIFFWMAFHQNSQTMTLFARDYTQNFAEGWTRIGFSVLNLSLIAVGVYALFSIFQSTNRKGKSLSGLVLVAVLAILVWNYTGMNQRIDFLPQIFQQFNPFFVIALTPFSIAIFAWLAKIGKEPSTPRKIGLGMLVAALGFVILAIASYSLASPADLESVGGVSPDLVSPNWLISTYFVLTFAELLLSPMGISFVTKVAPPKLKGLMMGGWFAATGIGNFLTFVPGYLWNTGISLWMVWGVLIVLCLLSAIFIFSIIRRLENATK
ncbi:MAG: peptide MFS transporter [Dysgonamonadaceae bacterium]|jgi:POT family proton-dependent oligopeptide transporter|nr:peptide MFS transporter [Dysgonamonadaceae bacterium]